jgi:toxin ParE1/3/4
MARWQVQLVSDAERDFGGILEYTKATYGSKQARIYESTLTKALIALRAGPDLRDSVARDELAPGVRSLHIARKGRKGRHLIIYRALPGHTIEVVRILHDAMDLKQHVE